jgi:AcrR family transcriptional regulator
MAQAHRTKTQTGRTRTQATRKRLAPAQRRVLIEDCAARLFAEHGYAGTRLQDIARAAGVTKPMLYRHFPSKKALHLALLAHHWAELREQITDSVTPGPLQSQFPTILDAWFGYVEHHPYAWRMLFRDTTGDPDIQAFHRELHADARTLTGALIESQQEISLTPPEIEPLAEIVRSATTGLALWWLENPQTPRSQLVDIMTRLLDALIASAHDSHRTAP